MTPTRKLCLTALAALAALALTAPAASAGWKIQTTSGAAYTGPLTMTVATGTAEWYIATLQDSCPTSTLSGTVTNAGPATPAATINSASWNCGGGVSWAGKNLPWNATIQTFGANQGKFTIGAPQLYRATFGCPVPFAAFYGATTFDAKVVPQISGADWVRFSSAHTGMGLNNAVTWMGGSCPPAGTNYKLEASYRLRGQDAKGQAIDLKVVSTP